MDVEITKELVEKIDKILSFGLSCGLGIPIPGEMCVEAAICYSLGLNHGDDPKCVNKFLRAIKIDLNDAIWSSKEARAKGLRNLAILQLGTKENFDEKLFLEKLAMFTCTDFLPYFLSNENYEWFTDGWKDALTNSKSFETAIDTARVVANNAGVCSCVDAFHTAADAADAAYYATSLHCAYEVASSNLAYSVARAATRVSDDLYLNYFAKGMENILIEMNVPAKDFI